MSRPVREPVDTVEEPARRMIAAGRSLDAIGSLVTALAEGRGGIGVARLLARLLGTYRLEPSDVVEAALRRACAFEELDLQPLVRPAVDCLFARPGWAALRTRPVTDIRQQIGAALNARRLAPFDDPLLHAILARGICHDIELERILVALREVLATADSAVLPAGWIEVACALARQAANNEYAWPVDPDEAAVVDQIVARMERCSEPDGHDLVRASLYRAPRSLPKVRHDGARGFGSAVAGLLAATVDDFDSVQEPELLRRLGSARGGVAERLQRQYEENPYPRWLALNPPYAGERRGRLLARLPTAERPRFEGPIDVLIAGCGTGRQAVAAALGYGPPARLTAIDLSAASLTYAARMARRYHADDIEFVQLDLLDADRLGRSFDVIEAIGVLHHLERPLDGWRALARRLKPGGLMNVAVYSERGRRDVVAARQAIQSLGLAPTVNGIRALRRLVLEAPPEARDWRRTVRRFTDFFTLSGCRDLLFNIQEHRFTPLALRAALDQIGVEVVAVEAPAAALAKYRARYPNDPAACDLELWDRFEADHPDTFSGMIGLWCRCQR